VDVAGGVTLLDTYISVIGGVVLLLDTLGHYLFWEPLFGLGVPVLTSSELGLARPAVALGTVLETAHGTFKVVSPDRVLARERYSFWDRYQSGVLGTIEWTSGVATVRARLMPSFVVAAVLFGVVMLLPSDRSAESAILGLLVPVVLITMYVFLTRYRMNLLIREYRETRASLTPHI